MEVPGVKERIDDVFNELAKVTGLHPECPFCRNTDWVRVGEGRAIELRTVYEPRPVEEEMKYVTGLGLQCTQCGFLRVHMVDPASWGLPAAG